MMGRTIKIDVFNVEKSIRELERYKREIEQKTNQFVTKIAQYLGALAQVGFRRSLVDTSTSGAYRYADDVIVNIDVRGDTATVIAEGEETFFCEFGTGVYFNGSVGSSPHPEGLRLGMLIGSYGKGKGRQKAWVFKDEYGDKIFTRGVPAQMPMYKAFMKAYDDIEAIAREVYG